jgi:hypothetical protein
MKAVQLRNKCCWKTLEPAPAFARNAKEVVIRTAIVLMDCPAFTDLIGKMSLDVLVVVQVTKETSITVIHLWIVPKNLLYEFLLHNFVMAAVKNVKEDVIQTAIVRISCLVFPGLA